MLDPSRRPNPIQRPNPRPNPPARNNPPAGGNQGNNNNNNNNNRNQGNNGGNREQPPSPWLDPENEPNPSPNASFVEYLRWMREPNHQYKDATKVQILQMATDGAKYDPRLQIMKQRLELIAGKSNTFQVQCPWRIRVGGHRGPESILLPAFDALGVPFIPSSTLRGVARTQAIREVMKSKNIDWKLAESDPEVTAYFGSLEADNRDKAGKVVFFDAYPLPKQHGLAMDMANNIWKWEGNNLGYSPNPNPFLSLKEPTFLIGLKLVDGIKDTKILDKVKNWLQKGLQAGIGSQINTGYGEFLVAGKGRPSNEFFRVEFAIEGQLIHGNQRFTQWQWNHPRNEWQMRGNPVAEVRPTALKSMMRYWFRVFALGVLDAHYVSTLEAKLFGGINPREYGYLQVNLHDGKVTQKEPRPGYQGKNDPVGEQEGTLILSLSAETPSNQAEKLKILYKHLTWLMFNMGGIGQGARRPCYSRKSRERAPWYRGSTFYLDSDDDFWTLPNSVQGFKKQFQKRLQDFYAALAGITPVSFDYRNRVNNFPVTENRWLEAADANCQVIICAGEENYGKAYALSVLHSPALKIKNKQGQADYDGNLCGKVVRGVAPSPVWIADLGDFQVVTVFGANQNPRRRFLEELRGKTSAQNYGTVFPLT